MRAERFRLERKTFRWLLFFLAAGCSLLIAAALFPEATAADRDNYETEPNQAMVLFEAMTSRFREIRDYRCLLIKQEWIDNRMETQKMNLLFRKPMDIKLSWLEPFAGQQALYRQGFNGNRIRARRGGLLGLFSANLDPQGKQAMEHNRYPITHAGIGTILQATKEDIERGQCEVFLLGEERQENRLLLHLRFNSLAPAGFHQSKSTEFWVDKQLHLPVRLKMYDDQNRMVGHYFFSGMEVNVGLTDKDFEL